MTNQPNSGHQPLRIDGGSLGSLSFHWSADRYHHQWEFEGHPQLLLQSDESDHATVWPVSPPLQQIHQQSFGDGREVVFGVGMSGRGHWSASFTLIKDLNCWITELACRSSAKPPRLLSTYATQGQWYQQDAGILACSTKGGCTLTLEAIAPIAQVAMNDQKIIISPVDILADPSTTQWAFRLRAEG